MNSVQMAQGVSPNTTGPVSPNISPVFEELQRLEGAQSATHELILELEQRIEAILVPPMPQGIGKEEALPGSRLHGLLQERTATAVGHNSRLAQLIARLTV